ncbi:MAG: hypothetical protein ACXVA9_03060 [Bdellovibrionales bacterium]
MKVLAISLLLLGSQAFAATPQTDCLAKIVINKVWTRLSSEQLTCAAQNQNGKQTLSFLCNKNQKDLSAPYLKYLDFQKSWQETFKNYSAAVMPNEKASAKMQLDSIKDQWMVFGYRSEVEQNLYVLEAALRDCKDSK